MKRLHTLAVLILAATPMANAQDGSSCASAIPLRVGPINIDTSTATGWINNYGPLVSPSNDIVYTFTTAPGFYGYITATASNYAFAVYVLSSCTAGAGPPPIGATSTLNSPIELTSIVQPNTQYWVAITGTAAGGAGANGTVTLDVFAMPVTLQSFQID